MARDMAEKMCGGSGMPREDNTTPG